jgi:hypothetical protein
MLAPWLIPLTVIPAQAGIQQQERQVFATTIHRRHWIPACAGMTARQEGSLPVTGLTEARSSAPGRRAGVHEAASLGGQNIQR